MGRLADLARIRAHVKPGNCVHCGRQEPHWTPDRIVEAMLAWNREHGRPPTARDWRQVAPDRPLPIIVQRVFGSWLNGLHAAGLNPRRSAPGQRYWTKQRIADAMVDWRMKHGRWPNSSTDWEHATPEHPDRSTVYYVFGSWGAALDRAGRRRQAA